MLVQKDLVQPFFSFPFFLIMRKVLLVTDIGSDVDDVFCLLALAEMQKIIDAEKSDLFDVLAHVAYAAAPLTRYARATRARIYIDRKFGDRQQAFLAFVLSHYVEVGVGELDLEKLTPLLRLRYHDSIPDAIADLGKPDQITTTFTSFQKYLYELQEVA